MKIKNYAVIGHPIGHTMSPFIHKRLFELSNIDAKYTVIDIKPQDLKVKFDNELKYLDGFNITIPHKQNIIECLCSLDEKAKLYGSVNTVDNKDGKYTGYTTDPDGFLQALKAYNIPFEKEVTILGTGGVARTIVYEAIKANCDLTIAVRKEDVQIANNLIKEVENNMGASKINTCLINELENNNKEINLLINATPIGMYPNVENCPVSDKIIKNSKNVFDAVYNPLETILVQKAKAQGSTAVGGMSMLVWQAVVAHSIWDESVYNAEDIDKLCTDSANELKKNF